MLTLFSVPKPFVGHIGVIQRNAIQSWMRLEPRCEIILFGDETGIAEVAREFGLKHVSDPRQNDFATPLINDIFARAQEVASNDLLCYVNADIILGREIGRLVPMVAAQQPSFLMIGQRTDIDLEHPLDFAGDWEAELRLLAKAGEQHDVYGIDYMVFRRNGLGGYMPPFAVGRVMWDNWTLYWARIIGLTLIDATLALPCYHQNHNYAHAMAAPGGNDDVYGEARLQTPEQNRNKLLAFDLMFAFNIGDSTHCLVGDRLVPAVYRGWRSRSPSRQMLDFGYQWLPAPDSVSRQIMYRQFEPNELEFVRAFVKPGMTVVDVGAHHGIYTMLTSQLVGTSGRILAIEPSPREFVRLQMHLALNGLDNVVAWEGAVGSGKRTGLLRVRLDSESGLNSFKVPVTLMAPASLVRCALQTLDALLQEQGFANPDLVKLDIGGDEFDVLEGATSLLSQDRRPIILCDMNEMRANACGAKRADLYHWLNLHGFEWFIAGNDGLLIKASPGFCNGMLVAVPEERLQEVDILSSVNSADDAHILPG